jgi:hypothetical protein
MKILAALVPAILFAACEPGSPPDAQRQIPTAFAFQQHLVLPGTPETIYDAITGDISDWWDHRFSEKPVRLFIDPKPGGGFYEIFDGSGDGVLHATVIYAHRGKLLRLTGPLGLSGKAVTMVCSMAFEPSGSDSTSLTLSVHGSGEYEESVPGLVEQVWHHFLFERFTPYVESGRHLTRGSGPGSSRR